MSVRINRVNNANVLINGTSLLGRVSEASLPELEAMTSDLDALGLIGKTEYFSGFDKMEASLTWSAFYADIFNQFYDPFKTLQLQLRGNVDKYNAQGLEGQVPVVVHLTTSSKSFPSGTFKQMENVESLETKLIVNSLKIEMDGVTYLEFDPTANILKVNGEDRLATYRANLGL